MISERMVKKYCCEQIENIENYEEAIQSKELYVCHHKNEIDMNMKAYELQKLGLYWKRPANELIFLSNRYHTHIHFTNGRSPKLGKPMSDSSKRKLSENNGSHRQEVRDKISKTRIERKIGIGNKYALGSKGHTGLKWITNGIEERCIKVGEQPPENWRFGRIKKR